MTCLSTVQTSAQGSLYCTRARLPVASHALSLPGTGVKLTRSGIVAVLQPKQPDATAQIVRATAAANGSPAAGSTAVASSSGSVHRQHQQQQSGDRAFNWHHNWYPVAIMSKLPADRPTATLLLGIPMVIWRDGKGEWQVFEDRCPHRLAPLSEGRLDPAHGTLMCSYHGWQFDSTGQCTLIPQIGDPAAMKVACSSKKTCARRFPAQVNQGLLWVWPDSTSAMSAVATTPALCSQYGVEGWTLLGGEWFARDLEYGYDTLMENLFDPSHIPFAHHGIMGSASRDKALPLDITTTADVTPTGGFKLFRNCAPFRTAAPTDTTNNFIPPVLNSSLQINTEKGTTTVLNFYGIPLAPGKSRVITAFFTNSKVPSIVKKLVSKFEWVFHLGQNLVLDSDAMLLHVQERLLHEGRDPNWRTAFFLPATSDTGIIKFRHWYHDCAGGDIPWLGNLKHQGLGPIKPREVVMNRYSQHVVGCKSCSEALRWIQRLQRVSLGLASVAAAACISVVAAAAATTTAATGASGILQSVTSALAALPVTQTAVLGVLAVALLVAHKLLGQLRQRFLYVDYVHADR